MLSLIKLNAGFYLPKKRIISKFSNQNLFIQLIFQAELKTLSQIPGLYFKGQ